MPCNALDSQMDAFVDGELPEHEAADVRSHLRGCANCRARHESELGFRATLARLPVPAPKPGYFDQALAVAVRRRRRSDRLFNWRTSLATGAIAAAMGVWLVFGVLQSDQAPARQIPTVSIALETPHPVNLVFTSAQQLSEARVSLALPPGLEIEGYPGQQELNWTTDLKAGKNVLRLPLVARVAFAHDTEELVARLEHADGSRTFRLKVRVI